MGRKANETDPAIGQRIRAIRESVGLPMAVFGRSLGVSQAQQSRFEAGELSPGAVYLRSLVALYKVDLMAILTGEPSASHPPEQSFEPRVRKLLDNYEACDEAGRSSIESAATQAAKPHKMSRRRAA